MIVLGMNQLEPIAAVLKRRFNNLSAMELIQLSRDILDAINKSLKEER